VSFLVGKGESQSILHPVWNLAGTALISGQAANLTYTHTDPAGTNLTTGLTWTEPNSDGWYLGARVYSTVGIHHISVSNAAISTSAQGVYDYFVQTVQNVAGVVPSGVFLTTLANLKEVLEITTSGSDAYLTNLIARATNRIEAMVGRPLVQATYTEYADGKGKRDLFLRRGPIQSVTSVSDVVYDGSGTATTTSLAGGDYFARGLDSEDWKLNGWLERNGSAWTWGQKNYEVIYSAGFSTVPYDLEQSCIELAVWQKNQRKDSGTHARDIGSGSMSFRDSTELLEKLQGELFPYMILRESA